MPRPRPSAVPREAVELDAGPWAPEPSPAELERLRADVQRAERRAETAEERAERAERALERSRAREAQRPAPQPPPRPIQREAPAASEKPEPVAARPAPRKLPQRTNEGVDLNDATFENFRSLGLSVTQSARLIAQRDQRGGFRSLDELDGLWGMPRELTETLKRRCHV
jgi:DNA uptake protein ComE-like DNA-binding protein